MRAPIISLALYLSALLLAPFAQAETTSLQHDNSGNVTQRTTPQGTTTYTYDPLNRLTGESGPAKTQTITYDENGNRKTDGAGSYTYETTSNRMSTRLGLAVTFDPAGNLTADGTGRTFAYNQASQLYQVFQGGVLLATYTYDFTGLRIAKVTTASAPQGAQTVIYEYDEQEHLISEISGTGAPLRSYAWRGDTPVAQIEHTSGGDKTLHFDPDHLNTPRAAMDETGKVVWRWESDAFGTTLPDEDPDGDGNKTTINSRFWGTQYYDVESGLHYNGHRYYSPLLRIFTQTDRLDLLRQAVNPLYAGYSEPTDLQRALNQPFNYTSNNPMSRIDPLGLLDPKNDAFYYPRVEKDAANRLNKNVPLGTPTIPGMDRQQTIDSLSKEIADRMTVDEADSCNPAYHPFGYKAATKKVGQRILDDMKKDHPNYPWKDWEPYFDKIWQ